MSFICTRINKLSKKLANFTWIEQKSIKWLNIEKKISKILK